MWREVLSPDYIFLPFLNGGLQFGFDPRLIYTVSFPHLVNASIIVATLLQTEILFCAYIIIASLGARRVIAQLTPPLLISCFCQLTTHRATEMLK